MDTIASGICLASAYENLITCGVHQNKLAKRLVEELNAPFKEYPMETLRGTKPCRYHFCRCSRSSQLGVVFQRTSQFYLLIIMPQLNGRRSRNLNVNWDVRATTQIIFAFLSKFHQGCLTKEVRKLLLAGLIADTARFKHADVGAFQVASDLLSIQTSIMLNLFMMLNQGITFKFR